MATVLKIPFGGKADAMRTLSLPDPKDGLTKAEVDAFQQEVLAKKALIAGSGYAEKALDAYMVETTKKTLA